MISELTAVLAPTRLPRRDAWCARNAKYQLAAVGVVARRLAGVLGEWAKVPVLPDAALWEASVIASQLSERW